MKKLLATLTALFLCLPVLADDHGKLKAEVMAAAEAFNESYATNDVETYFGFYAEDAQAWWYGERVDMDAYYDEWTAMIDAGGGVETNTMSDIKIQILPSKDVAIVSAFIDNTTRTPDGAVEAAKAFETDVWRNIDGEWKIVHLHFTVIAPEE